MRSQHEPAGGLEHRCVAAIADQPVDEIGPLAIEQPRTAAPPRWAYPGRPRSWNVVEIPALTTRIWAATASFRVLGGLRSRNPSRRPPRTPERDTRARREQRGRIRRRRPTTRRRCGRAGANLPARPSGTPPCTARRSPPSRPEPTSAASPDGAAGAPDRAPTGRRSRARTRRSRPRTRRRHAGQSRRPRPTPTLPQRHRDPRRRTRRRSTTGPTGPVRRPTRCHFEASNPVGTPARSRRRPSTMTSTVSAAGTTSTTSGREVENATRGPPAAPPRSA